MWTHEQSEKVRKYLPKKLGDMSAAMSRTNSKYWWFCDGSLIFMVNELKGFTINPEKHELIGVYDKNVTTNDLRNDLLWYIETHLETKQ